jgi:predicted TIM-barrel fold metal-dependent hydrolase
MNATAKGNLDLSDAAIIDAHCHGFDKESLLAADPGGWLDRLTLMGMCLGTSNSADKELIHLVPEMTRNTLLTLATPRWLAPFFSCTPREVTEHRRAAMEKDPEAYIKRLLLDQNVIGLFVDDGYPQPKILPSDFENLTGVQVHRVVRIEPLIQSARQDTANLTEFENRYITILKQEASDPKTIALKSIIAYRTGLDVTQPDRSRVKQSYRDWKESGWIEDRHISKAVRDHLLHVSLEIAGDMKLPFHIHTGGGDPDVLLPYARPSLLMPLLKQYMSQPVVLIHCGYPWIEETAFLASIFPCAYVELSVMTPWSTLYIDRALELFLGSVPVNKLLHGSDEASEPELLWLAAKQTKAALSRVLNRAMDRDMLTLTEAKRIGNGILAQNALKLHGLDD